MKLLMVLLFLLWLVASLTTFVAVFWAVWKRYPKWFQSNLERLVDQKAEQYAKRFMLSVGIAALPTVVVFQWGEKLLSAIKEWLAS